MNREFLIAAGAGFASAILSASILFGAGFGGFLLAYFALLPILIIGLNTGPKSAGVGCLCGLVAITLLTSFLQGVLYGVSIALPSWMIAHFALQQRQVGDGSIIYYPAGHILAMLASLGAAMVLIAAIVHINHEEGFTGAINGYLETILTLRFQFSAPSNKALLVENILSLFPALTIGSWLLMVTINTAIAQAILNQTSNSLRSIPAYRHMTLPEWLYWSAIATAAVALLGSGDIKYVGRNVTVILAIPFFMIGLGTVHVLAGRLTRPGMALAIFYFMLLILGWPALIVAGLGFIEPWVELRKKFINPALGPDDDD